MTEVAIAVIIKIKAALFIHLLICPAAIFSRDGNISRGVGVSEDQVIGLIERREKSLRGI